MLRRFSINFALFSMLTDSLLVGASLRFAEIARPVLNFSPWIEPLSPLAVVPTALYVLFPFVWVVIYSALAIYDGRRYLRAVDEFSALTLATSIASISAAGILYLSFRELSRALFVVFVLATFAMSVFWRAVARLYFRRQSGSSERARRVLIVGAGPLGQRVQKQIVGAAAPDLLTIGFIDTDVRIAMNPDSVLGTFGMIREVLRTHRITDVVIALPHSAYHQLSTIVRQLDDLPVQVWVALGFFDLALYNTAIEDFAGIPMLDLRASAIDDYKRMVKRAFDVFFGTAALLAALPLMAVVALLIVLDDGFPVIFRQQRAGENGRLFDMLKFRTMVRNAEQLRDQVETRDADGNLIHKTRADPRITRVGRVLRRFSLDELPQFINVVRGDMSLVGPRPELPYLVEHYQPWQRKRFAVPPGITGWWQVSGRSDKPMHLHTDEDLFYIQHYSMFLDLQILLKTIWVVLIGKGSY